MDEKSLLFLKIAKACQSQLHLPTMDLAEALSDAVWLSQRLKIVGIDWVENDVNVEPPTDPEGDEVLPIKKAKADADELPNQKNATLDTGSGSGSLSSGTGDAYADYESSIADIPGRRIMFPSVPPLQGAREFERAWRPFAKRVPDWHSPQFDERATADQIAATLGTVWSIATKPKLDRRWKGVAIFERSPTMRFWQNTLDAFYKTMWRTSAFNRLQLAHVDGFKESPTLCKNQALTHTIDLQSITNETADEQVFFFTDFRSNAWLNGSMLELVRIWQSTTNVVIVHMMSEMHWLNSALRHFELTEVPVSHSQPYTYNGCIPIISFEPHSLGNWVNWSTGVSGIQATLMSLNPKRPFQSVIPVVREQGSPEADKERTELLYKRFVKFASEPAQMLARSLASAPLLLPVMRLIQRCEVPDSTSSHLSEILYSGLIKRRGKRDSSTDVDSIEYDFLPGVRDRLLSNSSRQRIDRVLHLNWEYMQSRFGNGINFNAIIADPSQADRLAAYPIDSKVAPFARVGGQILQRLGGKQAEAGSALLARLSQLKAKIFNAVSETVSERLNREYETLKVEFEDGTNLPKGTKFIHPNLNKADTYRPNAAKSSRLWRPMLRKAGFEFLDLLERAIVVSCSLHQSVNPSPARRESRNLWRSRIDTVDATVDGLSAEFEKLVSAKGEELDSEWAFVNEQGNRICNGTGNPQAFMLGMKRMFYLSGPGSPNSRERANTVKEFREIAKRASQALAMMSRAEAKKLWRNWKHGFPASCVGKEHIWYDALMELSFQKKGELAFERFLIPIHEDQLGDRVPLIGDGIFPRLPAKLSKETVARIPHQLGYPIDSEFLIADIVAASFTAINHLLGEDIQEQRSKELEITSGHGHFSSEGAEGQLEAESVPIEYRLFEFEDGTNVPKGSSFRESVRRSSRGAWYLPSKQVSSQNWKNDWQDILTRLRDLRSKEVILSCTLLQTNVPRVGDLEFSTIQNSEHKQSIRGCTGLGREFVALTQIGNQALLAVYPFLDVNRNPIATSAGEAFPYRLGFSRQYYVYEETDLERRKAFDISQRVFETFELASRRLRDLPKHISERIWNRWSDGFDSSKFGEDALWYDALFELAFNKSLSLSFRTDRFVGVSTKFQTFDRIKLTGDGLYPRIPIEISQKAYESIPNQLGYPDYFEASIPDLVTASIDAIEWIKSNGMPSVFILHGQDSEEHVQRCSDLAEEFGGNGYESYFDPDVTSRRWMSWARDAADNADRILVILSKELYRQDEARRSPSARREVTEALSVLSAILNSQNRKKIWVALLSKNDLDWRLDRLLEFPHIMLDKLSRNSMVLEGIMEWDSEKINNGLMLIDPKTRLVKGEPANPTARHRVFISFSHSDDEYRRELRTILKADDEIREHFFDDMEVKPGGDWDKELRTAASETRVMIMLVSPRYLDRENCKAWRYEIPSALEAHAKNELTILWVAAQQVRISDTPFSAIQACHPPSKPLDLLSEYERLEVYQKIRDEVKGIIAPGSKSGIVSLANRMLSRVIHPQFRELMSKFGIDKNIGPDSTVSEVVSKIVQRFGNDESFSSLSKELDLLAPTEQGLIRDPFELVKRIKKNAPQLKLGGKTYFIVERDLKLLESELLGYAKSIANSMSTQVRRQRPDGLVAATINGMPMRWELPVELTWEIDETSFAGRAAELAKTKLLCAAATKDWNDAAKEMGIDHLVQFSENTDQPVFRFAFDQFSAPGLYAVAFFPNDMYERRWVHIGPATFVTPNDFDPIGVLRHELGHVLGFRHEHIRPEAKPGPQVGEIQESWVLGSIDGENLTDYDSQSVMHYPMSNGKGTMVFKLSDKDKASFRDLYLLDSSEVVEFPI